MLISYWLRTLVSSLSRRSRRTQARQYRRRWQARLDVRTLERRRVLNAAVAAPQVEAPPPAPVAEAPSEAGQAVVVVVNAGPAARDNHQDIFRVSRSGQDLQVQVNDQSLQTFSAAIEQLNLLIEGSSDSDTLIVDFSGGNPFALGTITFSAGLGGNDSVQLLGGAAGSVDYVFAGATSDAMTAQIDGSTLSTTGVEAISDQLSASERAISLAGAASGSSSLALDGTSQQGQLHTASGAELSFALPSQSLSVDLQSAAQEQLQITGSGSEIHSSLRVQAGGEDRIALAGQLAMSGQTLSLSAGDVSIQGQIHSAGGLVQVAAQHELRVEAGATIDSPAGRVELDGGAAGQTLVFGTIDVSALSLDQLGGAIHLTGKNVGLFGQSQLRANGAAGGGEILVGGDTHGANSSVRNASRTYVGRDATIQANALGQGNGGKVVVWSDEITRYQGSIEAKGGAQGGNGGFVEVSGKELLNFDGQVNLLAAQGQAGLLLLDPRNITIVTTGTGTQPDLNGTTNDDGDPQTYAFAEDDAASPTIDAGTIATLLQGGSVTLQAHTDITVNAAIDVSADGLTAGNGLTLQAGDDILITANIRLNNGAINFIAGDPGATPVGGEGTADITINSGVTVSSGGGTITLNAPGTITLGTLNSTAASIQVTSTAGSILSNGSSITGGAVNLSGNTGIGASGTSVSVVSTGLTASTAGNSNIFLTSTGTASVTSINAGSGTVDLAAGTFQSLNNNAINNATTIQLSGATLNLQAFAETAAGLTLVSGNLNGTGTLNIGAATYDVRSGTVQVGLLGTGGLTKTTAGTVTLQGANTYSGTTNVNAGTLVLQGGSAILDTGDVALANTAGATLQVDATEVIGALSGGGTTGGTVSLNGAGVTLTTGRATNSTFSGAISGLGSLTKAGAGNLTLDGTNTFTGALTVNAGGLILNGGSAVANAVNVTLANIAGVFLQLDASEQIGTLAGGGGAGGNVTLNGAGVTLTTGTAVATVYSGNISGAGGVTKVGTGSFTLNGTNAFTGVMTISGGMLILQNGTALADTAAVSLDNIASASLRVDASEQIGSLDGGGTTGGNVALNGAGVTLTTGSAADTVYDGVISGLGALTKVGAGNFTLTGVNTYTGVTNVNAGTLTISATGSTVSATSVAGAAVLVVDGTLTNTVTLAATGTLNGVGTVTGTVTSNGGTLAPGNSPGILNTGNLALNANSTLAIEIGGNTPGNGINNHDQVNVTGTVTIGATVTLNLAAFNGYVPVAGDSYIIVNNDSNDAVVGRFNGLLEGAVITADFLTSGLVATISYIAGDGNDIAIFVVGTASYVLGNAGNVAILRQNSIDTGDGSGAQTYVDYLVGATEGTATLVARRLLTSISAAGGVSVTGGTGADTLIVDYATGGEFVRPVSFDGQGGVDPLEIRGGAATFTDVVSNHTNANSGNVVVTSAAGTRTITYQNADSLRVTAATINNFTFNLPTNAANTETLQDEGVAANGIIQLLDSSGTMVTTTFSQPGTSLMINGGAGVLDTINVEGVDTGYNANLSITGAAADLDVVAFNTRTTNIGAGNAVINTGSIAFNFTGGTNLVTTGDISLTATTAGSITRNGTSLDVQGDDLVIVSAGSVGLAGTPLRTQVNTLSATLTGASSLFLSEADALTVLASSTTNGNLSVRAGGTITVTGDVNARTNGNVTLQATAGDIILQAHLLSTALGTGALGDGTGTITLDSTAGAITQTAAGQVRASAGSTNLQAATGIGTAGQAILTTVANLAADLSTNGADLFVTETDGLNITAVTSTIFNAAPATQNGITTNNGDVTVVTGGAGNIALAQAISAGTGFVDLTAGGAISNTLGSSVINAATLRAVAATGITLDTTIDNLAINNTGTGNVVINEANAVTVTTATNPNTANSTAGITVADGSLSLTAGGNITQNNDGPISATTGITITVTSASGIFQQQLAGVNQPTINNTTSGGITIEADQMTISTTGSISAAGQIVTLQQHTLTNTVDLGGADAGTVLGLTDAELDRVTATTLRVGRADGGAITVSADINPASVTNLHLRSGSSVTESAGAEITAITGLAVTAGGAVTLAQANDATNIAITTTVGNVVYVDNTGVTVTTVDGVAGVTSTTGSVSLTTGGNLTVVDTAIANDIGAATGITLTTLPDEALFTLNSGANIQTAAGNIAIIADKMDIQGTVTATGQMVTLRPEIANDTDAIQLGAAATNLTANTLELSTAELFNIKTDTLVIGNGTNVGAITILQPLTSAGGTPNLAVTSLRLLTPASVSQSGTGSIAVTNLEVIAGTGIALSSNANDVTNLALETVTGGISYRDVDAFTVGDFQASNPSTPTTITGRVRATTSGDISLTSDGNDSLVTIATARDVTATSGNVTIVTDKLNLAGTISAVGHRVTLRPETTVGDTGDAIDLGSAVDTTANTLEISAAEVTRITADTLEIGATANTGAMTISQAISTTANSLLLKSAAGVAQAGTGALNVAAGAGNLEVIAGGAVTLGTNQNAVTNLAIQTSTGDISYRDVDSITVGDFTAQFPGSTITGRVSTLDGSITMSAEGNDSTLTVAAGKSIQSTTTTAGVPSNITLSADKMNLAGSVTANSAGQIVTLRQFNAADAINLGSTVDTTADTMELSASEISRVTATAGTLRIGRVNGGAMTIGGATAFDLTARANIAHLMSGGAITQTAGSSGSIQVANLALEAGGNVDLSLAANDFDNVVVAVGGAGGNVCLRDTDGLTISGTAIDGVAAGIVTIGSVAVEAGGNLTVSGVVNARGNGSVTLQTTGATGDISYGVDILSTAANVGAAGDGNGVLTLRSLNGSITRSAAVTLRAQLGSLALRAATNVGSAATPILTDVATLAGLTTGVTGDFYVTEASGLSIGSVTAFNPAGHTNVPVTNGITVTGDLGLSVAGDICIFNTINVGAKTLTLTSTTGNIQDCIVGEGAGNLNIIAGTAILTAQTGIGSGTGVLGEDADLDINVGTLTATNNTSGQMQFFELDSVALTRLINTGRSVVLEAGAAITDGLAGEADAVPANTNIEANDLRLQAVSGIGSGTGALGEDADLDINVTTLSALNTGSNHIQFLARNDLGLVSVTNTAAGQSVVLDVLGQITDARAGEGAGFENLTTSVAVLQARNGIGSGTGALADAQDIDIKVDTLTATNLTVGNIQFAETDSVAIDRIVNAGRPVTLSAGLAITDFNPGKGAVTTANANIVADTLLLQAVTGIGSGSGVIGEAAALDLNVAKLTATNTGAGSVQFYEVDDVEIELVDNGPRNVAVEAVQAIKDSDLGLGNDFTAGILNLKAGNGIGGTGVNAAIETTASQVNAVNTAQNGIFLNSLLAGTVTFGSVLAQSVGNIELQAAQGAILTDVQADDGSVTLNAAGAVTLTKVVTAADKEGNDICINTTTGDITVVKVSAGLVGGNNLADVDLVTAAGAVVDGNASGVENVGAQDLTVRATAGVDLDTRVNNVAVLNSGAGNVRLREADTLVVTQLVSLCDNTVTVTGIDTTGNIVVTAGSSVNVFRPINARANGSVTVTATTGDLLLTGAVAGISSSVAGTAGDGSGTISLSTPTGSILSDNNAARIMAANGFLNLQAANGAGTAANNLQTTIAVLAGRLTGLNAKLYLTEADGLTIGTVGSQDGIVTNLGDVQISSTTGNIAIAKTINLQNGAGAATNAGGTLVMFASAGAITDALAGEAPTVANLNIIARKANLNATAGIGSGTGVLDEDADLDVDLIEILAVNSASGNIQFRELDNVAVDLIDNGTRNVVLDVGQQMTDLDAAVAADFIAGTLNLRAVTGIGASGLPASLETNATTINARNETSGGVYLNSLRVAAPAESSVNFNTISALQAGNVELTSASGATLTDVRAHNGSITVETNGTTILTSVVTETTSAANPITVTVNTGDLTATSVNSGHTVNLTTKNGNQLLTKVLAVNDITATAMSGQIDLVDVQSTGAKVTATATGNVIARKVIGQTDVALNSITAGNITYGAVTSNTATVSMTAASGSIGPIDTATPSGTIRASGDITAKATSGQIDLVDVQSTGAKVTATATGNVIARKVVGQTDVSLNSITAGNITYGAVTSNTATVSMTAASGSIGPIDTATPSGTIRASGDITATATNGQIDLVDVQSTGAKVTATATGNVIARKVVGKTDVTLKSTTAGNITYGSITSNDSSVLLDDQAGDIKPIDELEGSAGAITANKDITLTARKGLIDLINITSTTGNVTATSTSTIFVKLVNAAETVTMTSSEDGIRARESKFNKVDDDPNITAKTVSLTARSGIGSSINGIGNEIANLGNQTDATDVLKDIRLSGLNVAIVNTLDISATSVSLDVSASGQAASEDNGIAVNLTKVGTTVTTAIADVGNIVLTGSYATAGELNVNNASTGAGRVVIQVLGGDVKLGTLQSTAATAADLTEQTVLAKAGRGLTANPNNNLVVLQAKNGSVLEQDGFQVKTTKRVNTSDPAFGFVTALGQLVELQETTVLKSLFQNVQLNTDDSKVPDINKQIQSTTAILRTSGAATNRVSFTNDGVVTATLAQSGTDDANRVNNSLLSLFQIIDMSTTASRTATTGVKLKVGETGEQGWRVYVLWDEQFKLSDGAPITGLSPNNANNLNSTSNGPIVGDAPYRGAFLTSTGNTIGAGSTLSAANGLKSAQGTDNVFGAVDNVFTVNFGELFSMFTTNPGTQTTNPQFAVVRLIARMDESINVSFRNPVTAALTSLREQSISVSLQYNGLPVFVSVVEVPPPVRQLAQTPTVQLQLNQSTPPSVTQEVIVRTEGRVRQRDQVFLQTLSPDVEAENDIIGESEIKKNQLQPEKLLEFLKEQIDGRYRLVLRRGAADLPILEFNIRNGRPINLQDEELERLRRLQKSGELDDMDSDAAMLPQRGEEQLRTQQAALPLLRKERTELRMRRAAAGLATAGLLTIPVRQELSTSDKSALPVGELPVVEAGSLPVAQPRGEVEETGSTGSGQEEARSGTTAAGAVAFLAVSGSSWKDQLTQMFAKGSQRFGRSGRAARRVSARENLS